MSQSRLLTINRTADAENFIMDKINVGWWPNAASDSIASFRLRCKFVHENLNRNIFNSYYYSEKAYTKSDILVLSKRYDEDTILQANRLRNTDNTRVVLDLCDNHLYHKTNSRILKQRRNDVVKAINSADIITVGSEELKKYIRAENPIAKQIVVINESVEPPEKSKTTTTNGIINKYRSYFLDKKQRRLNGNSKVKIIWFGNAKFDYADGGMQDVTRVTGYLKAFKNMVSITILSNDRRLYKKLFRNCPIENHYIEWHSSYFSKVLSFHDISVIPVNLNPFTMCKTDNRVKTSLLHGLPVVADLVPSYLEHSDYIILDNWMHGLERLITDQNYRTSLSMIGREKAIRANDPSRVIRLWEKTLISLLEK